MLANSPPFSLSQIQVFGGCRYRPWRAPQAGAAGVAGRAAKARSGGSEGHAGEGKAGDQGAEGLAEGGVHRRVAGPVEGDGVVFGPVAGVDVAAAEAAGFIVVHHGIGEAVADGELALVPGERC
jgi:hypothetical protein